VTCPLHNWVIGFEDGEAVAPDVGCTKTYAVQVEKGEVYLQTALELPKLVAVNN
jgi:nitrite reductase (NADH) small subunit